MKLTQTLSLAAASFAAILPLSPASANFEAASPHIDLDGTMIGYMDFTGDGQEIGTALNDIYVKVVAASPEMPPIPVDFNLLFDNLGFSTLQSVAMSSKDIESGLHRNRSVAIFNGEPTGLFAIYDTAPLTFKAAEFAPADATGAMSASVNLGALRATVSKVLQQVMGPMGEGMMQQQLSQIVPGTDLNYNDLIDLLSGRWDGFWHQSYGENFQPSFKFWVSIEEAGSLLSRVQPMVESMGIPFVENEATLKANLTPLLGASAEIDLYVEASKTSGALILYSNADWSPHSEGERLVDSAAFKALAERLPSEGMAFSYNKGADLAPMMAGLSALPEAAVYVEALQAALDLLVGDYLKPSMAVSVMEGNVMYSDQYAGYSTKQVITALPVMIGGGLGAAMAIPAFQKVRSTSQEKTVTNNLRQIASAADQYFLENGVTEVSIDKLVGEYIRELNPVAGESYEGMIIRMGEDISVTLGDGSEISIEF